MVLSLINEMLSIVFGMLITKNSDDSFTYTRSIKALVWDDKMYLFPIPQSERMKNPNLSQNAGW